MPVEKCVCREIVSPPYFSKLVRKYVRRESFSLLNFSTLVRPGILFALVCLSFDTYRSPNSMWHLDSTHKLTRCKFIASGMADGHSRLIIWAHWLDNNRALITHQNFVKVTDDFSFPLQVWGNKGTEIRLIAKQMIILRYHRINSYIGGKLVHNVRIEWLRLE